MTKTQSLYTTYGSIVFVIYNVKPEIINNSIAHLPMTDQQEVSVAYGFDEILFRYYREIPHLCYSNRAVRNCKICAKTAYNLEQRGEISYTVEQNRLIRTHKIKLTDILEYL